MQETITIARPYARAVFEQAHADGELQSWSDMLQLLKQIAADPAMQAIIKNPRVSRDQVVNLVIDICGTRLSDKGRNFVKLLVDAGRLQVAPQISSLYEEKKAEAEGTAGVEVVSAYPLDSTQQDWISRMMAKRLGRKIEITTHVDQSLIGGVIIRAGDSVIDVSLRGRLKQLGINLQNS